MGGITRAEVITGICHNNVSLCDANSGAATSASALAAEVQLVVYASLNALLVIVSLVGVRYMTGHIAAIEEQAVGERLSISDYTVQLRPRCPWNLLHFGASQGGGREAGLPTDNFQQGLQRHLEATTNVQVARNKDGTPCIWLCYSEETRIGLWRDKIEQLRRLEVALSSVDNLPNASPGDEEGTESSGVGANTLSPSATALRTVDSVATQLSLLNARLAYQVDRIVSERKAEIVCAFVVLEEHAHQNELTETMASEYAVAVRQFKSAQLHGSQMKHADPSPLLFAGEPFRVDKAPEPNALQYAHLPYTPFDTARRKVLIVFWATVAVAGGSAAIVAVRTVVVDITGE